jgi:hypothetical protein
MITDKIKNIWGEGGGGNFYERTSGRYFGEESLILDCIPLYRELNCVGCVVL